MWFTDKFGCCGHDARDFFVHLFLELWVEGHEPECGVYGHRGGVCVYVWLSKSMSFRRPIRTVAGEEEDSRVTDL